MSYCPTSSLPSMINASFEIKDDVCLLNYIEKNTKNLDHQIHGMFVASTTTPVGGDLSSTGSITFAHGTSRLMFSVISGNVVSGTMHITGTKIDRETAEKTYNHVESIAINGTTINDSYADPQGNTVHQFTGSYITPIWLSGALTITTEDLEINEMLAHGLSYEQFNDNPRVEINCIDKTFNITNTAAWFYSYLYKYEVVSGDIIDVYPIPEASMSLTVAQSTANRSYRLRRSGFDHFVNGATDGIWEEVHFGPDAQQYFRNFVNKMWVTATSSIFLV